jgi:transposase
MLNALVAGTTDPALLAELARGRLRPKIEALQEALTGRFDDHHALLVAEMLAHIDYLEGSIARLDAAIAAQTKPFQHVIELLDTIPGINNEARRWCWPRSAPT